MLLVSRRSALYRHARDLFHECGAYQLRAVLNIFDKDAEPEELYHSPAHCKRDWSLPWLMPGVLARHGVKASWHFWPRSRFVLHTLAALDRDEPALFVINSIVRPGKGLHWISAWGYDEATDEFLCYDSKAPAAEGGVGNARYTTKELLSHLPFLGTFVLTIEEISRYGIIGFGNN